MLGPWSPDNSIATNKSRHRRQASVAIILATCLLLGLPVLADLAGDPVRRPFGYAAADTFYYLSVARNIVLHGSVSMDGTHATNGFHPLWQLLVAACYGFAHVLHRPSTALLLAILTSLAFLVAAVWVIGQTLLRSSRAIPFIFLGLPFGLYALLVLPQWAIDPNVIALAGGGEGPLPLYGTLYSFANGMESGLTIFAFAVLAWTFVCYGKRVDARSGVRCAAALVFVTFARLDHAALAVFPLCYWFVEAAQDKRRRPFAWAAIATFVGSLLIFLLCNRLYAGSALPVSGVAKSTFPFPRSESINGIVEYLKHPLARQHLGSLYRWAPPALSLLATFAYLLIVVRLRILSQGFTVELRAFTTRFDRFLVMMAPGIVLLDLYNILFVYGVGHWYFPVTTLAISLNLLSLLAALINRSRYILAGHLPQIVGMVGVVGLAALVLVGFTRYHRQLRYHEGFADFCLNVAPRVRQALHGHVPKILEFDDGIVSYGLNVPAMSGFGYTLDREALTALQERRLLQLAVKRGFSAATTFYYRGHDLTTASTSTQAAEWVRGLVEMPKDYQAKVLYGDPDLTMVEVSAPVGSNP
ncbi:MAG TPA: hypothetical protein VJ860_11805 [Polyangia bacterium]|jgi:hypothetical protein|nr:hypothetical protein [Polyangia bacterium]